METDDSISQNLLASIDVFLNPLSIGVIVGMVIMLLLLIASALISGSEVSFFSLTPLDKERIENKASRNSRLILKLLDFPERLLGTILIANNFVNIALVIVSSYILKEIFNFEMFTWWVGFVFQVVIVTFLLLLFGEILPKVYASHHSSSFSYFMALPLSVIDKVFRPISYLLIKSTRLVNKYFSNKSKNISIDQLSDALDLTEDAIAEDKNILKGIVKFGNIVVTEIMRSRIDVVAVDTEMKYSELIKTITDSGYSRIPVYTENVDDIKGMLFVKDLLPHLGKDDTFNWQALIRKPYYVPENKKINDLLEDFRLNKIHMALVVDEYGGFTGLVTMEDIIEEIVGEIKDESDEEEITYRKIAKNIYIFDGKTLINDFCKVVDVKDEIFDEIRGDAETLAGLILELKGEIPKPGNIISYKRFDFKVEMVDKRRIRSIRITLK